MTQKVEEGCIVNEVQLGTHYLEGRGSENHVPVTIA